MDVSALETFKAIARQLSVPEKWFGDNEISPVIVKSEGLDDSLEVPANLDDTQITSRAAGLWPPSRDCWPPPAASPQVLTNCSLLKQIFKCFKNISSSVFIHIGSVFLVRKVLEEGKYLGQQIQSMNPKPHYLNLEENYFLQLP